MKKILAIIFVFIFSTMAFGQDFSDIKWVTEDYPPYNFTEKGIPQGIAVDFLLAILKKAGSPIDAKTIKIYPWQRGVKKVKSEPGTCLFSTTLTKQRQNEFQWKFVYPIPLVNNTSDNKIIARKSAHIVINSMEDLKNLSNSIGVVRGDVGEALIKEAGVQNNKIDEATDGNYLIKKLGKNRYDVISFGFNTAVKKMNEEGINPDDFEIVFTFPPKPMGYAFYKDTDPALLKKMQTIVDELTKDGTAAKIVKKYSD